MSKPAKTIFYFGLYLLLIGFVFLFVPHVVLEIIEMEYTDIWPRVLGMIIIFLGYYYIRSSRENMSEFFRWTVHTRFSAIFFLGMFVLLGYAGSVVLIFGLIDLLGALWTRAALKSSKYAFSSMYISKYK